MDKELIGMVGVFGLVFLFILPGWVKYDPNISIDSAVRSNSTVSFTATYSAPVVKSCFLVSYGPFMFDGQGHEEGNNIYVLTTNTGTLSDSLTLQPGHTLDNLKMELWCDNDKLSETQTPL